MQLVNNATEGVNSQFRNILQEISPGYNQKLKPHTRQKAISELTKAGDLEKGIVAAIKTINSKLKIPNSIQFAAPIYNAMLEAHKEGWTQTQAVYDVPGTNTNKYTITKAREDKFLDKAKIFNKSWSEDLLTAATNILTLALKDGDSPSQIKQSLTNGLTQVLKPDSNIRAATHNAVEMGRLDLYKAYGNREISWLTAPGERINEGHAARDEEVYDINLVESMLNDFDCTCTTIPGGK